MNHGLEQSCLRLSEKSRQDVYNLILGGLNSAHGNWNTGCEASEVFAQLEFKRKICVYVCI